MAPSRTSKGDERAFDGSAGFFTVVRWSLKCFLHLFTAAWLQSNEENVFAKTIFVLGTVVTGRAVNIDHKMRTRNHQNAVKDSNCCFSFSRVEYQRNHLILQPTKIKTASTTKQDSRRVSYLQYRENYTPLKSHVLIKIIRSTGTPPNDEESRSQYYRRTYGVTC